jgi:branched-chain amino acid transport system permease protein
VGFFGNLLIAGLVSGAIYGIFGLLLCLLCRVSLVLNLAIGDFAMLGAVGVAYLVRNDHVSLGLAIAVDLVAIATFAVAYDRLVLTRALGGGPNVEESVLIVFFFTLALSFFIEGFSQHLFGLDVYAAPPLWAGSTITLGGVNIQRSGLLVLAVGLITGVGVACFLRFSLIGKAMTAAGDNAFGAKIVGIRSSAMRLGVFVVMSVVAAVFGIILSPIIGFTYSSGGALGLTGIIAAALGGLRHPSRALLAGLAIGIGEAMVGGYVTTEYQTAIVDGLLVAFILYRPQILGDVVRV